jgi:hypothetical protein
MDAPGTSVGQGKAGLRKKMESRYEEVASPLQVVTSLTKRAYWLQQRAVKTPALDPLYT